MAEEYERHEGHRHHLHRREENEYGAPPGNYQQGGGYGGVQQAGAGYNDGGYNQGYGGQPATQTNSTNQGIASSKAGENKHKHEEEAAGLGGAAAGAYALYERHEAKKDPQNAHRHQLEEEVAGTGAVGAEGFALYERHKDHKEKKELSNYEKQLVQEQGGEKKHHFFG